MSLSSQSQQISHVNKSVYLIKELKFSQHFSLSACNFKYPDKTRQIYFEEKEVWFSNHLHFMAVPECFVTVT